MISLIKDKKMTDAGLISYYKTEYFREWHVAWENGVNLTASDIRARLNMR